MRGKIARAEVRQINPWVLPLALVALIVCVLLGSAIEQPWLAWLAVLNALLCLAGVIRSISSGLRPVALVYYIFTFAWLGVAPAVQIATGQVAWHDISALSDPWIVALALATSIVATLSFFVGSERARDLAEKRGSLKTMPTPPASIRMSVLAGITFAGVLIMPLAIQANGGLGSLFTSRRELTGLRASLGTSMDEIGGPAYALTRILPGALAVAGALLAIYALRSRWTSFMHVRVGTLLMLCVAFVSLVLFSNPLAYSRFTAAVAFGSLLLAVLRPRSPASGAMFATLMLFATLLIYPLANVFRSQNYDVKSGVAAFTSADFDGFQQVINTLTYVQDLGHTWGLQTLSGIGFFVPRSLWDAKADPASYAIAEHAGYTFTNLSLPIHAEFYLEFGWVGIILGMGLLGFVAGKLDHAWINDPGTKLALVAPYAAFATLGVIRGPLGGSAPVWGAVILLLLVAIAPGKSNSQENADKKAVPRKELSIPGI